MVPVYGSVRAIQWASFLTGETCLLKERKFSQDLKHPCGARKVIFLDQIE
jgi:hypothetical protein